MNNKIEELTKKIAYHSQLYYSGNPIIDDISFDKLIEELESIFPEHPILKTIGWGYTPVGEEKVKHKTIIGSLTKIRYSEISSQIFERYQLATPKIDGGSVICYYNNGYLENIVSRGDGSEGINITPNLRHAVPIYIEELKDCKIAIRGEVILTLEDFKSIGGSSARNKAVGLSQTKYADASVKKLKFVAYSIVWIDKLFPSRFFRKDIQLHSLSQWGFTLPEWFIPGPANGFDLLDWKDVLSKVDGDEILIDGMVLSSMEATIEECNSGYFIINPSIAVKFEEETAIAKILEIRWTVNRTGRIVPVATISPVVLSGATITSVTCYNYGFIISQGLGIGAEVVIVRANEVIPKIIRTNKLAESYNIPSHCPICDSELKLSPTGLDLLCVNELCQAKLDNIVWRIFETVKPDGIGEVTLDELCNFMRPEKLNYLFDDVIGQFDKLRNFWSSQDGPYMDLFGPHMNTLVSDMLDKLFNYSPKISEIVYMANIPAVGEVTGESLNAIRPSDFVDVIADKNFESIRQYFRSGISYTNFVDYSDRIKRLILFFGKFRSDYKQQMQTPKLRVAVTGKMSCPREQWFEKHPIVAASEVTKGTDYLVTNDSNSGSSKNIRAKELGVKVVSEEEFEKVYATF